MTEETAVLVTRETRGSREATEAHATRLREREVVDEVRVASYEREPARELAEQLEDIDAEALYAVPFTAGHSKDTRKALPRALSRVSGHVSYCRPAGAGPHATEAAFARAREAGEVDEDTSLVFVGFGGDAAEAERVETEAHAERTRESSDVGQVVTCYLIEDPSVECVRYNIDHERAVAVPLFMSRCEATEEAIPRRLELDRGGVQYAEPLGSHPAVTDNIQDAIESEREPSPQATSSVPVVDARPVATDGEG